MTTCSTTKLSRMVVAHYDISAVCTLRCEGCFFFDRPQSEQNMDQKTTAEWEQFFAAERERGVNFAIHAGAEPALQLDRLRIAQRNIPDGVVFTNGLDRIPDDLHYRIHLSIWSAGPAEKELRGAEVLARIMENYRKDPRALIVFVVTALNLQEIVDATRIAHAYGLQITFSYFSPPMNYKEKIRQGKANDNGWFRISTSSRSQVLNPSDFQVARREIERAIDLFPDTVLYSLYFDDWVSQSNLHDIDPATGLAKDCGARIQGRKNYRVDMTSEMKCGAPEVDCATCRGYLPSYATYFLKRRSANTLPGGVKGWKEIRRIWTQLVMLPNAPERI